MQLAATSWAKYNKKLSSLDLFSNDTIAKQTSILADGRKAQNISICPSSVILLSYSEKNQICCVASFFMAAASKTN